MMNQKELAASLEELGLGQSEAGLLLSVDPRSVRRWATGSIPVPGPVEQAIRAWLRLNRLGLAWKPGDQPIGEGDLKMIAEQIAKYREHAIELDAVLQKVKARGGPRMPWKVDLRSNKATLGHMSVSFYRHPNGSFSPSFYNRSDDKGTDAIRDIDFLEDAYACIADAIAQSLKS